MHATSVTTTVPDIGLSVRILRQGGLTGSASKPVSIDIGIVAPERRGEVKKQDIGKTH